MASKTLVTSALPYANGPLHIGHMVEFVQTDIYVRFLRSCGEDVIYLCADDTHGTPIELNAAKQGIPPEQFVKRFYDEHRRDLDGFGIQLDAFWSTHSPENQRYSELVYRRLQEAGDIERKAVEQAYCETDRRFLPDRFIRGTCPNCKSPDQYGDVCEKCGKTYSPTDLIDPRCALCGTAPLRKVSEHLFFRLSRHQAELQALTKSAEFLHPSVSNQLQQFFEKGLNDWDISRDGPYFGFPIPGETDKFFYVWLDAPIGYIATTEKWAQDTGKAKSAMDFWDRDADARVIHFIGKDIVYFHALFWPAVLGVARFKLPARLNVHGHLTVDGQKMSKSRGTLIAARTYLDALHPTYLRYFYAANLGPGPEDFDLSLRDFRLRVNGELVNNIGNLANRALTMLAGPLGGTLSPGAPAKSNESGPGRALVEAALARVPEVRDAYAKLELRAVVRIAAEIGQSANQFLQAQAPWVQVKKDVEAARRDLTDAAEIAYLLGGLLAPVVPALSEELFRQLGQPPLTFAQLEGARYPLLDRARPVGTPAPLIARLEEGPVNALVKVREAERVTAVPPAAEPGEMATVVAPGPTYAATVAASGALPEIEYDEFAKVSLKAGRVLAAERVPKADKLLKLSVDVGETSPRTIAAGIAEAYTPEAVVGRRVVVVANLKARKIRGIESRGMLLAGGAGGKDLSLVDPGDLPPGADVK